KLFVSAVVRAAESSVSLPAIESWLRAPVPTAAPVETPTCDSIDRFDGLPLTGVATALRRLASRSCSPESPYSTPFARSALLFALVTGFSVSFDCTKSIVELYWSMNACTFAWIPAVSGPGAPIVSDTGEEVTPFSVNETPASPSVTVFELEVLETPSIEYEASCALCDSAKPKSAAELPVTEMVLAAPVALLESTSLPFTTVA